jgi:aspartyl-tRNA(Asn)/glutamyl-tRNA(Gln) amidotransferase subunit C
MDIEKIVDYAAALALLEIQPDQKKQFSEQIGRILKFVEKLQELNTDNVAPTSHVLPIHSVTRPDVHEKNWDRESFLKLAPDRQDDFFKVPAVIQES